MTAWEDYEIADCRASFDSLWVFGFVRDAWDQEHGAKDRRIALPRNDSARTAALAGAAECYMAILLGLQHGHAVTRPDPGYDLVLRDGRLLDVKWSPGPWLNCSRSSRSAAVADLFALVCGEDAVSLEGRGYCERGELIRPARLRDWGYGRGREAYSIHARDLHPLSLLRGPSL